ncbi:hypothetical protein Mithridates_00145 [Acinetobacter phage Mithridates]|nr:hypothetical protein Mithridates_00145 [Acinetobacter phage Mithridates]
MTTYVYVEMSEGLKSSSGKLHEVDTSMICIQKDTLFEGFPEVNFDMLMETLKEHLNEFEESTFLKNWQGVGFMKNIPQHQFALRMVEKYKLFTALDEMELEDVEYDEYANSVVQSMLALLDDLFNYGDTIEVIKIIYAGEVNHLFG